MIDIQTPEKKIQEITGDFDTRNSRLVEGATLKNVMFYLWKELMVEKIIQIDEEEKDFLDL